MRVASASSRSFRPSFSRSSRLRETRSLALDLGEQLLVELELVLDHLLLEGGRHADEAERRMRDDDRVPGRGRGARQEAMPLVLGEVGLVGDEDSRARIERQELARGLRQAMAGNDQHRLGDQAEPALLHDSSRHGHRLAGADGMGEIGRARGDDAPDAALLVSVKNECARGARQLQMRAVEGARHDVVEAVVVDPRQPIGPVRIGPDPVLEGGLDLVQLLLRRLGIDDVEDATLAIAVLDGVEDLRH